MQVARGFDVLHEMAYPGHAARHPRHTPATERALLQALQLARSERLVDAAFSYRFIPLEGPPGPTLRMGGETLPAAALLPTSGRLTALACCACTLGPRLQERVRELYADRRMQLAAALENMGADLLDAVVRRAHDRIHVDAQRQGISLGNGWRSGEEGLPAEAEATVLRLARAERIGVLGADGAAVRSHHFTALAFGAGVDLPPEDWSRCEHCPKCRICRVAARLRALRAQA